MTDSAPGARPDGTSADPTAALTDAQRRLRTALIDMAEANHAHLPQYRGRWDGWSLGELTRDVYSKTGRLNGTLGTPVLVGPELIAWLELAEIYLPTADPGGNLAIDPSFIRTIGVPPPRRAPETPVAADPGLPTRRLRRTRDTGGRIHPRADAQPEH